MKELCVFFVFFPSSFPWILFKTSKIDAKQKKASIRKNNTYLDTSLATMPKIDEPRYCDKSVETLKTTSFN